MISNILKAKSYKLQANVGFTLIELLTYIAVLAVVGAVLTGMFISLSQGRVSEEVRAQVQSELRFALDRIEQDLKSATAITSPIGGEIGSTLTITVDEATVTYTLSAGQLTRNSVVLTSNAVEVADLDFEIFTNTNIPILKSSISVQVGMTIDYNDTKGIEQYSARQTETFVLGQLFSVPSRGSGTSPGLPDPDLLDDRVNADLI